VSAAERESSAAAPELVRVNGRDRCEVSALERGLQYGDGVFETIACVDGRARFLPLHLNRLAGGCARLGLPPTDRSELAREVQELATGMPRAVVKLILTRGPALARGYGPTGGERPTRITRRYPWPAEDGAAARDGVRVRLATLRLGENPALAGLKHCNRLEQVLARSEWTDPAIVEALMFSSSGALVSGTMSNVFIVRDSRLLTPRLDRCGVAGVMREVVLAIAKGAGLAAEERLLEERDLLTADEVFLTNALTGIRPVCELEGAPRAAGPLTRALQSLLAPLLASGAAPGGAHD